MPRPKILADSDVLKAAHRLMHERGPEALTFESLGRACGLSPATLVQRFRTKAELKRSALLQAWDLLDERTARLAAELPATPAGAVELLVSLSRDYGGIESYAEGLLVHPIKVVLPKADESRDRWLTRSEAAKLLLAASPHVRRFILLSLYTGRRATAVLDLTWPRVDLAGGTIRFRAEGEAETNKRRGRVRIPRQLAAHLRRWHERRPGTHVVMFRGDRLGSIKHGIARAAERAGLSEVTPHVLKHTAITWAVKRPVLTSERL